MKFRFLFLILMIGAALSAVPAFAAPGDADTTFNGGVPAIIDNNPGGPAPYPVHVSIDPANGDILHAGYQKYDTGTYDYEGDIVAYTSGGTLDTAFGGGGMATLTPTQVGISGTDVEFVCSAVDSQGRILAAGYAAKFGGGTTNPSMLLARFKPDGTLDTSFGTAGTGIVINSLNRRAYGSEVALTADGHILVIGKAFDSSDTALQLTVWRFNADGSPDSGFGTNGHVQIAAINTDNADASALSALQPNGALITGLAFTGASGASPWKITRLNPDGSVDTGFGSSGFITGATNMALADLVLAPDGGFVIGEYNAYATPGTQPDDLQRFLADGSPDTGFNGGSPVDFGPLQGAAALSYPLPLTMQPDGKILVTGNITTGPSLLIERLLADGTLDSSFGSGGNASLDFSGISGTDYTPSASAMALQGEGKIVVAGYAWPTGGSYYATFTTRALNDTFVFTPAAFSFMNQGGVNPSVSVTSNAVTISGLTAGVSVPVHVSGGEYKINSGVWTNAPGFVQNGDQIAVRQTSSPNYATRTNTTLTVGGEAIPDNNAVVLGTPISADFAVTTKIAPRPYSSGGGGLGVIALALLALLLACVPLSGTRAVRKAGHKF